MRIAFPNPGQSHRLQSASSVYWLVSQRLKFLQIRTHTQHWACLSVLSIARSWPLCFSFYLPSSLIPYALQISLLIVFSFPFPAFASQSFILLHSSSLTFLSCKHCECIEFVFRFPSTRVLWTVHFWPYSIPLHLFLTPQLSMLLATTLTQFQ